jgi:prohibitin 2
MEFEQKLMMCVIISGVGIVLLLLFSEFYYIVDPGNTAIHLRMGRITTSHTESGMYFKMPMLDSVVNINNRICKKVITTTALSKDLQSVSAEVAINYCITDAIKIYKSVGADFENIILDPYAQESIKAIVATFTAEDLIRVRDQAKLAVFNELKMRLDPVFILLIDFNFVHLDFTAQFTHAVEEKQIAEQLAKTAHNLSEKVKEEALQTKLRAEAEAYAFNVKKLTLTKELIELKKIEKWDGKLPVYAGANIPLFING